ncbi:MAG: thymidine phosphorylase [Gemmatimonadetes bacterium]|nr:thymidine phosphorylase [Gemmatimonadota bacterium]
MLAPLVASLGIAVPMMSGRGLGHTGGTTDKLESIPGFRTDLPLAAVQAQVARLGVAMFRQTEAIAPADRRLHALRDVTGTVPAIPAHRRQHPVQEAGRRAHRPGARRQGRSGAFLPAVDDARALARTMVDLVKLPAAAPPRWSPPWDRPSAAPSATPSRSRRPCSRSRGRGRRTSSPSPGRWPWRWCCWRAGPRSRRGPPPGGRRARLPGAALDRFRELIEAQGGDPAVVDDPGACPRRRKWSSSRPPPRAPSRRSIPSPGRGGGGHGRRPAPPGRHHRSGAWASWSPGRPGARVAKGEPIASVFAADPAGIAVGLAALGRAIRFGEPAPQLPLLVSRITAQGETRT